VYIFVLRNYYSISEIVRLRDCRARLRLARNDDECNPMSLRGAKQVYPECNRREAISLWHSSEIYEMLYYVKSRVTV